MEQVKRVVKNTGFLYARMAITVFISLYVTRLVLAALGAEDFGTFMVVAGSISMLTFLNAAMASASQRFMSYAQGQGNIYKQKNIFNVSVVLHFIIAILLVIILEVAGYFLFDGIFILPPDRLYAAKIIYQFMIVSTLFAVISVPYDAVINAHEHMLLVAVLGVLESILKLGIAFYITYTSFDKLISYGLLMALLSILLLMIRRIYCHRRYEEVEINVKKYYDKPLFKEMTEFAGWSFLGSASSMTANYGQGIVLNMFFGTIVNAAQGVSSQVSGQLGAFSSTMMKALNPVFAKSEGAGNRSLMIQAAMTGSKMSFFLLMALYIPVFIEMPYIFNLWLKEVPNYAVIFCQLLLIRNLIEQLFNSLTSSIGAVGKIKKYQIYSSILGFSPLIVSFLLFKFGFPPYYLYITFIIYSIFASILILYFSKLNFNLNVKKYLTKAVFPSVLTFIIVFGIAFIPVFIIKEGLVRLLVVLILSSISTLTLVWFIGLSKIEKGQFSRVVNSFLNRKN